MNGAAEKELEVHCRSEGEVAGYRHLLAFMHSMGKEVPQGELMVLIVSTALLLAGPHAQPPVLAAAAEELIQLLLLVDGRYLQRQQEW